VASCNLVDGTVTFYRLKVDLEQTHKSTADTVRALQHCRDAGDCPTSGRLLRGSRKGGALLDAPLTESAIKQHVRYLGRAVGVVSTTVGTTGRGSQPANR
jgi:hypothetical protein